MAALTAAYGLVEAASNTTTAQTVFHPKAVANIVWPRDAAQVYAVEDWPLVNGIKVVGGTVYKDDGSFASGCTVKLFRQHDDAMVAQQQADQQGLYAFPRDATDPFEYYVMAFIVNADSTVPQTHGVSDRGVLPA